MKKKQKNLLISLITIFFLIEFLLNSKALIKVFFNTLNLCFYNLLPNIFIFFIITDILNNYDFPYLLSKLLGRIIEKLYHLPRESSYIIFMSLTSGFPGNSKLIKDGLDNNTINSFDATRLLTMTHFANPLFIIYTIGISFFNSFKIGLIILLSHFLTNFIVGLFFRNIFKYNKKNISIVRKTPLPFLTLLKTSFINTTKIIINVFGIIIFFAIISATLSKYLNLNSFSNTIFNGLIEITNGLKLLSQLSFSKIKAATLATFFISFGGLSIHMQTMSILNKYNINYYIYLISRLLHAGLSSFFVFIIMSYC